MEQIADEFSVADGPADASGVEVSTDGCQADVVVLAKLKLCVPVEVGVTALLVVRRIKIDEISVGYAVER